MGKTLKAAVASAVIAACFLVGLGNAQASEKRAFTWHWSDLIKGERLFTAQEYQNSGVPVIKVKTKPGAMVWLRFYQDGQWESEDVTRASSSGSAAVRIDPICANQTWCDGEYLYKIETGGSKQTFKVKLSEN